MQKQQSKKFVKNSKPNKPIKEQTQTTPKYEKRKQIKKQYPVKATKGNEQLPTIQDMLSIPKEQRQSKSIVYFKKIKPFLKSYIQRKQGSRVIHLIFKWSGQDIKQQIYKALQQNWKQLIKSQFALHVITIASSQFQFSRLADDAVMLQNNLQGSMLLQNYLIKNPSTKIAHQIYNKFDQIHKKSKQNHFQSQQVLHNLAMKSIQKGYYSNKISALVIKYAFPTMIEQEKAKVIQFAVENMISLFANQQWVKLFITIYNYLDSKQKKNVVKQLKGKLGQLLSASKLSYVALIKILTQTDDTVFVGSKLILELMQSLTYKPEQTEMKDQNQQKNQNQQNQKQKPAQNPHSQYPYLHKTSNVLMSLLSSRNNNFNCLGKIQKTVQFTTCKKPQQTRKKQIREFIYPTLIDYTVAQQNINKMCVDSHLSRLTLGLIKSMQTDGSQLLKQLASKILKYFLKNLEELKVSGGKKINIKNSITADNFGSKLLKNILLLQQPYIDKYADKFSQIFKNNLEQTLHCNASFVMTILIEKGRNQLIQQIKRSKINVTKAKAADFYLQQLGKKTK